MKKIESHLGIEDFLGEYKREDTARNHASKTCPLPSTLISVLTFGHPSTNNIFTTPL